MKRLIILAAILLLALPAAARANPIALDEAAEKELFNWSMQHSDNIEEQVNIGYKYLHGSGVTADAAEAVKWYQKAAEKGDAKAQMMMGDFYYEGIVAKKDDATAAKWYRMAAENGMKGAQFMLSELYRIGAGVPKDIIKAYIWLYYAEEGSRAVQDIRKNLADRMTGDQIRAANVRINMLSSSKTPVKEIEKQKYDETTIKLQRDKEQREPEALEKEIKDER